MHLSVQAALIMRALYRTVLLILTVYSSATIKEWNFRNGLTNFVFRNKRNKSNMKTNREFIPFYYLSERM